jgi:Tol biopolymer transport system component
VARACRIAVVLALLVVTTTDQSGAAAQISKLRVLFYGYVDAKPRVAFGLIDADRVSDVADVPFLRHGAEISPDGTLLAFDTCRKGDRGLHVARLDGSDERRLVDLDADSCVDIRWSRDGTRVSYGHPLDRQLHIVDLATAADTPLPYTSPAHSWHTWSAAGDAIAYEVGRGGSRRINVIDVATWRTRELVATKQFGTCEVWAPDWSPISDRLVFTTCKRQLFAINGDGTGLVLLAESAYAPRWAPDGMSILFLSAQRLMRIEASGGRAQQLGVSPYLGGPFSIGPAQ